MLIQAILLVSALVQVVAAVLSLRLIRITGRMTAWMLLAFTMVLQAIRRIVSLVGSFDATSTTQVLDVSFGLVISLGMLAVAILIRLHFENLAQRETLFRTVADFTSDMEVWLDLQERWRYVSPSCERITGLAVEAFLADPDLFERRVHPEDLTLWQAHQASRRAVSGTQRDFEEFAFRILRPEGEIRWIGQVSRSVQDAEGRPAGWRISLRDITERKQVEAENAALAAKNQQLQKAESLGRMAGAIAHHFNNKLQAVLANLELLGALPKGVDPARCVAMAKLATERAAEVSRLMLLYLGQTATTREPRYLAELCRDGLVAAGPMPERVSLTVDSPEPGPVIEANANEIQRVLTNLLANAREAIGDAPGAIRIRISTCTADAIPEAPRFPVGWHPQGTAHACLELWDSGCGVPEPDLPKLFDPFFSTKFTGRGLGLPVVLGIVNAHHGVITVESRPGEFCAVRVYFPLSTAQVPETSAPDLTGMKGGDEGAVLLVDDDEFLLMSTGAMIEMLGFTLLTARDGIEALDVFRDYTGVIRCVITDLEMPRMGGWETLAALRRLKPDLPVILASGYDKARAMSGSETAIPQAILEKPFGLQQLREALGLALKPAR